MAAPSTGVLHQTPLDHHVRPIRSAYFERRDLTIRQDEIVVVACMRNEVARLPYFLRYYRSLGVDRFLLVDNDSSDGTSAYLAEQDDVDYFWTDTSYRGSAAGRLWLQELADTYATDRWVITVDVDELLVFPGSEALGLHELCSYLDDNGHQALFTVMLDMYSDRPLSQTPYEPGDDFIETCPYFETDTYVIAPGSNPPFIGVFGGPRGRLFKANGEGGSGPMMKKIPLVRWREGFSYIFSTHSHRYVPLSDVTGVLLHFKFFDTFRRVAAQDALRGDRRQATDYRVYQEVTEDDVCFYGKQSRRYRGPADLVRLGVMRASSTFERFATNQLRTEDRGGAGPTLLPEPVAAEGSLSIRSIAAIWPLVNNRHVAEYFGRAEAPGKDRRLAFVEEMGRHVKVLDVQPDHLLVRLAEPALHRWQDSRLGMSVYVGGRPVRTLLVDGAEEALEVDVDSLEPGVCRLPADVLGAARLEVGDLPSVAVTAYLFDADDAEPRQDPSSLAHRAVRREDILLYHQRWFPAGGHAVPQQGIRGTIDRLAGGRLRGWAYDAEQDTFELAVCIYIDGRLVRHAWPTQRRVDLDDVRNSGSRAPGRGFAVDLPLGYFDGTSDRDLRIEAIVAGRNLALRRSPLVLPRGVRDARWVQETTSWDVADAAPVSPHDPAAGPGERTTVRAAIRSWWRVGS